MLTIFGAVIQRNMLWRITLVIFVIPLLIFNTLAFTSQVAPVSAQIDFTDTASKTLSANQSLPTNQTLSGNQTAILGTLAKTLQSISTNQTELQQILNDSLRREYLVHVVWRDDTSGDSEINYKRTGGKFDPTGRLDLTANDGASFGPVVVTQGMRGASHVYMVWSDSTGSSVGKYDIWFKRSQDGGATWRDPIRISNSELHTGFSDIAVVGNNVYVVWEERVNLTPVNYDIFFSMSSDDGYSFSDPINLSNNNGGSWGPTIAGSASSVHVMWADDSLGAAEIVYRKSVDDGNTFGGTTIVSNTPEGSWDPDVAVGRGGTDNVYLVWTDTIPGTTDSYVRFTKSVDGGTTFGGIQNITSCCGGTLQPAIDVYWEDVYIVYTSGDNVDLRKSANDGDSFGFVKRLSSVNLDSDWHPAVSADGDEVYVAWTSNKYSEPTEILLRRSTDGGERWEHFTSNLSNDRGSSSHPSIAIRPIYSVQN